MAGPNDFTGQNIQDTYQRVLQISSSSQITDGTGSVVQTLNVTASYAISASHEITYELSSSYAETASVALKTQNALTVGTGLDLSNSAVNWTGQYGRTVTLDLTEVIDTDGLDRLLSTNADGTLTAHSGLSFDGTSLIGSGSETGLETTGFISCSTMIVDGQITASGNISASGDVYAESIILPFGQAINWGAHDGNHISVDSGTGNIIFDTLPVQMGNGLNVTGTNSHITASGNISSSGDFDGDIYYSNGSKVIRNTDGVTNFGTSGVPINFPSSITSSGNISSSGTGDNYFGGSIVGKFFNSTTSGTGYKLSGAKVLHVDGSTYVFGRDATTKITGSSISLGSPGDAAHVTASGNISASGIVEASAFVGQRVTISNVSAQISTPTQNQYFYGGSTGLSANTWNVILGNNGGSFTASYGSVAIAPQYINNIHTIPCGVKNVTLKSTNRLGGNNVGGGTNSIIPSIWIFTGSIVEGNNHHTVMGFAASQSLHTAPSASVFATAGTGTHHYSINITGSKAFTPGPGHEHMAVMLLNEGTGTQSWRFNYRLDAIATE